MTCVIASFYPGSNYDVDDAFLFYGKTEEKGVIDWELLFSRISELLLLPIDFDTCPVSSFFFSISSLQ